MNFVPRIRAAVQAFTPYTAGESIESVRERFGLSRIIKMASNENPLGVSPVVEARLKQHAAGAFRYPASGNPRLVAAIAAFHKVDPARVVVTNGSDEMIDLLVRVCVEPGQQNVAAFKPCFGIYSTQTALCGVELVQEPVNPDFSFPWDGLLRRIDARTSLVFITTPDNPTGFCPPLAEVERFAAALPQGCLLVIDEAYMDFAEDEQATSMLYKLKRFPHVAILRTFSKSFGLAGVRLGYGILPLAVAQAVRTVRLPFSVNILAEEAGLAALTDMDFYKESLRVCREGRAWLEKALQDLGCTVFPSGGNFLMIQIPGFAEDARPVFDSLLRQGIIVRPLASYGLPGMLRVSVGTAQENAEFIRVLQEHVL